MPVDNIIVEDKDIKFAEKILLNKGQTFDKQRLEYINDFSSLDLMAVPGSGKTTLLLAKLLIIERNLPLNNNAGVLVISHTNIAVKEIEDKIKIYCPSLFRYPNFIGTIQSFVNKFLALPFYEKTYKRKIQSLDDIEYNGAIERYYQSRFDYKLKRFLSQRYDPLGILKNIRLNEKNNLVLDINGTEEDFFLKDKETPSYISLREMKERFLKAGILHYDDAYYFAIRYIKENPMVIKLLRKRFRYVFVDEMQDMDVHQYQLLEKLFGNVNNKTSYQRLGDNNQAIYNDKVVNGNSIWKNRDKIHTINGSNRLTKLNANLASRFSIDNSYIEGLNERIPVHKPVLLIYDQDDIQCSVIQGFSKYLNQLYSDEDKNTNLIYKVVSWRCRLHKDEDKIVLSSYCPNYMNMRNRNEYLKTATMDYYGMTQELKALIVYKLNLVKVKIDNEKVSKSSLVKYFKEQRNNEIENQKLWIYRLINTISKKDYQKFILELNDYLIELGKLLNVNQSYIHLLNVQEEEIQFIVKSDIEDERCYKCDVRGNNPIVNSVHSVKGETHNATLFLESFYNKNYESDILHEVICGKTTYEILQEYQNCINLLRSEIKEIESEGRIRGIKSREGDIKKLFSKINVTRQYSKLVYVALTRATGVVGYGVSSNNYDKYLKDKIDKEEWKLLFI